MANDQDQINELVQKLELLLKKQQDFNIEVNEIRRDIQILRNTQTIKFNEAQEELVIEPVKEYVNEPIVFNEAELIKTQKEAIETSVTTQEQPINIPVKKIATPKGKSNLEKFIGENLINKIGILITVIGVVIGAKYSIENNLISPLTRIILGYLMGLGLLGFAFKLKAKYENYSAVLVSGALAIIYFITFAAYDLYGLFPQLLAYGIMLLCTVFGVVASLNYNKQVIAHIGLVGAYGVPFLLSNNSGNTAVLFSYMALINIGILIISLKKYWKALYYISFAFTWLTYGAWHAFNSIEESFYMGFTFLTAFFLIFYATFLAFKLLKTEHFKVGDIILILLNSFIFYGFGIAWLYDYENGESYLGLFTLANASIHFSVTLFIFKKKLADRKLFFLTSGFVLTFITIAIPVQLDGNWVTLIWAFEAALLFWIGRSKKVSFYEHLSYIMVAFAILSLIMDWTYTYQKIGVYDSLATSKPFFNSTLLTSLLCVSAFSFMTWIQTKFNLEKKTIANRLMVFGLPVILILSLYLSFYLEVDFYWNNALEASEIEFSETDSYYFYHNYNLRDLGTVWKLFYTMLFVSILSILNSYKIKNKALGIVATCSGLLVVLEFLSIGLYTLSELRENFLSQELSKYFEIGNYNIYIRYIGFTFFALLLFAIRILVRQDFMKINYRVPFEIVMHISIIWILSSELLNWMDLSGSEQSYKLGLSILWGLYALLLIAIGIWKKKKYLRIGAIILFSFTLIKLFFYDISSLNTISKTIVFVSLGVLLLIISFLYNKYKHIIADESK